MKEVIHMGQNHSVSIGNRQIGDAHPCYVIAEAGSNHNGDLELAKELIDAASRAGADAIKFQAFRAAKHYSRFTPNFTYLEGAHGERSTYDLIRSIELHRDWHPILMEFAESRGIMFLSSPTDTEAIDQLAALGMPAFKLASFDLPDLRLIRYMARFERPLILSTGMANYADIQQAIDAAQDEGNGQVVLLQCTSLYPAPAELSNLAAIRTMRQAFGVPVGYSDHTLGDHVCLAAVALGAGIIEKHFTLDRTLPGPDHAFAIEPDELSQMMKRVRDVEAAIGNGIKRGPRSAEVEMFEKGRRSLHAARTIRAGEVIRSSDLFVKRPGYGISPSLEEVVVGLVAQRDIAEDHWITWQDVKAVVE
jgi:sialic acid synthase SpsE